MVLLDKLGKLVYNNPDLLYYYKGVVPCPPLQMVDDVLAVQKCSASSLHMNTVINTFMELEKLTLSKTKCSKIHIGRDTKQCRDLKVHEEVMKSSKSEKYLGDIVHESGTQKPNIASRLSKAWGRVRQITGMVKEAPLGRWRITSGLLLRKALLINATLFNSEAWHSITVNQVEAFEKIDEALLRNLVGGHAKIPLPSLYFETGQKPIRFILACRRILFLQTILHRSQDELIRKVYSAQKADPTDGDFCQLVAADSQLLDCQLSDDQISSMTRYDLKTLVKAKATEAAFRYLLAIKETKTKMDNLSYQRNYQKQPYLERLSSDQSSLLLALRTRTYRGIRSDFGEMFPSKDCPLNGCLEADSLPHTLVCRELQGTVPDHTVQYGDVFSPCPETQDRALDTFTLRLEARERILETQRTSIPHCWFRDSSLQKP